MATAKLILACLVVLSSASGDTCQSTAEHLVSRAVQEYPANPIMWSWSYGPSIMMSSMYDMATQFSNSSWARFLDERLANFITTPDEVAYKVLHNITMSWDTAVGDHIGLFPIAYLSQRDYHQAFVGPAQTLVDGIITNYVYPWPLRLNDTSHAYSRDLGWPGQPSNKAAFVWADDQYMGLTQLARYARISKDGSHLDNAAQMQLDYAALLQDVGGDGNVNDGLMYHGYDAANQARSCCKWGRANGWIMLAHVEVLQALQEVKPESSTLAPLLALFRSHALAMLKVQRSDGLWSQVLNESSTFPETSVTAMTLLAWIKGVEHGWLSTDDYGSAIQSAWQGLSSMIETDGTVKNICSGCGIQLDVHAYQIHSTVYNGSQPGLGSVWAAVNEYAKYSNNKCST